MLTLALLALAFFLIGFLGVTTVVAGLLAGLLDLLALVLWVPLALVSLGARVWAKLPSMEGGTRRRVGVWAGVFVSTFSLTIIVLALILGGR